MFSHRILGFPIGYLTPGLVGLYYASIAVKFHEDVDFETNEFLSESLGLSIDDKIVASYQNFNGTKIGYKKNDNLMVVTNRKIYFACFNGSNWMTLTRTFGDIQKIGGGLTNVSGNSLYLRIIFNDESTLGLRLERLEKISSEPGLFIQKFYLALDAYLLGNDVFQNSRRRVAVSNEKSTEARGTISKTRSIELSTELLNELKNSEEIKPGRTLEI